MSFFQSEIVQMWLKQLINFTLSKERIINQCEISATKQTQTHYAFHRTLSGKFYINNSLIKTINNSVMKL